MTNTETEQDAHYGQCLQCGGFSEDIVADLCLGCEEWLSQDGEPLDWEDPAERNDRG